MNLQEYNNQSKIFDTCPGNFPYHHYGIIQELGEALQCVQKAMRPDTPVLDTEALKLELGDVFWYVLRRAEGSFSIDELAVREPTDLSWGMNPIYTTLDQYINTGFGLTIYDNILGCMAFYGFTLPEVYLANLQKLRDRAEGNDKLFLRVVPHGSIVFSGRGIGMGRAGDAETMVVPLNTSTMLSGNMTISIQKGDKI